MGVNRDRVVSSTPVSPKFTPPTSLSIRQDCDTETMEKNGSLLSHPLLISLASPTILARNFITLKCSLARKCKFHRSHLSSLSLSLLSLVSLQIDWTAFRPPHSTFVPHPYLTLPSLADLEVVEKYHGSGGGLRTWGRP